MAAWDDVALPRSESSVGEENLELEDESEELGWLWGSLEAFPRKLVAMVVPTSRCGHVFT